MSGQMIGNKVVNALSQILVGGLQNNNREVEQEGSDKQLSSRRPSWRTRCTAQLTEGAAAPSRSQRSQHVKHAYVTRNTP